MHCDCYRVVAARQEAQIKTTSELVHLIGGPKGGGKKNGAKQIHPATRTFQVSASIDVFSLDRTLTYKCTSNTQRPLLALEQVNCTVSMYMASSCQAIHAAVTAASDYVSHIPCMRVML